MVEKGAEGRVAKVGDDDAEGVAAAAEERTGENVWVVAEAGGLAADASREGGVEAKLALPSPEGGRDRRLRDAEAPRELHLRNHLLLPNSMRYKSQPTFHFL